MTRVESLALGPDRTGKVLLAEAGRITRFGDRVSTAELPRSGLDCRNGRIQPGRVNAHTHIYSGLVPLGMPPPDDEPESFLAILERIWWRLDRALDEASLRAAARYYVAQALLAGTTTLIDHHESPSFIEGSLEVLAEACQELGMRAVLCYGATERNGGRREAQRGLEECRRFLRENDRPLVRGVVGLHASFTVSDETLAAAAAIIQELGTILHVHLGEDLADVEDARARGYAGPLARLLHFAALPKGSILAHCVHCQASEVRRIASEKLWIVQNPRSNRSNAVGYPAALGDSDRVALGTDGYPADMEEEARVLRAEAVAHDEPGAVAKTRLQGGSRLAAEHFGLRLEPLAEGGAADCVVVDAGRIVHVVVAGRPVVGDGQLLTGDWEHITAQAKEQAARLWLRMGSQ